MKQHTACATKRKSVARATIPMVCASSRPKVKTLKSTPAQRSPAATGEPFEAAARLILRHFPREQVGEAWERCYHHLAKAPITRPFLRRQERWMRIDHWRKQTGRKGERGVMASLNDASCEGEEIINTLMAEPVPQIMDLPATLLRDLLAPLTHTERLVAQTVFIDEQKQNSLCSVTGLGEARISQLIGLVRAKLYRFVEAKFPGLREELC
jgi:hypothetical protein